ncbi:MAG: response regulator, partial [Aureispira sp.]|nr:response regulator [Aureispira sp.]
ILDLSKLEDDRLELEEDEIHLLSFIQAIFDTFKTQANYLGVNYQLKFEAPQGLYLFWDSNKMEKVLNNLLSNALKFTPSGQEVSLVVKDLDTQISIMVQDTGKGIHPDDRPYIFDRFYQSSQPDRPAQGGTGIGLALVTEFVQLMQGHVELQSELTKGSSFTIFLPKTTTRIEDNSSSGLLIDHNSPLETTPELPTIEGTNSFTILLVEDNADMRNFISSLLEIDYTILTATDGLEGLAMLKEQAVSIDLIISDVMMPNMDGFTMLEEIKANANWRNIPIVMLTALAREEDKLHALTVGVHDYLTKPFSIEELTVRVANLLQNAQERKAWIAEQQQIAPKTTKTTEKSEKEVDNLFVGEADLNWLKTVEEEVKEQLDNENFNVAVLAKKMNVSDRQLTRKLKKITGLTPAKFIKEIRLNIARTYLEAGTYLSVSEVAFAVGFQTVEAFSKSYKTRFGKPPREYLNK